MPSAKSWRKPCCGPEGTDPRPLRTPDIPVISEEAFADAATPPAPADTFWLVDPLDGTKEFVRHNGNFTVNIALIQGHRPVLGVVHAPVAGATYWTPEPGHAMLDDGDGRRRAIAARTPPAEGLTVVGSRAHGKGARFEDYLTRHRVARRVTVGSSIKFCLLARGDADLYPRVGTTMQWDTAAGHALLLAAGGRVETVDGEPLAYGKPGFENPPFIARGRG